MAAALILLANVRSRGGRCPGRGRAVVFVALVIGVLYQRSCRPLRSARIRTRWKRRTFSAHRGHRAAFGLDKVKYQNFAGSTTISKATITADTAT